MVTLGGSEQQTVCFNLVSLLIFPFSDERRQMIEGTLDFQMKASFGLASALVLCLPFPKALRVH